MQQFIELRVDTLRVPMLRALYQQRHQPGGQCSKPVPVKAVPIEDPPQQAVSQNYGEGPRARGDNPEPGQKVPDALHAATTSAVGNGCM
jgi:hypothetical protein